MTSTRGVPADPSLPREDEWDALYGVSPTTEPEEQVR